MSVRDYIKSKYSKEEWQNIEKDADLFVAGIESLQSSVSSELRRVMEEKHIGYRELGRILGVTDAMTSKMLQGGSVNFETITKLSLLNRKVPKIIWVDQERLPEGEKEPKKKQIG